MGAEEECLVARNGRMLLGPGGGFGLLDISSRLIGQQSLVFRSDEVADDLQAGNRVGILGIALGYEKLASVDFRDTGEVIAEGAADRGGVEIGMHQEDRVIFSIANEVANAGEKADVESADSLIGRAGLLIRPMNEADLVVIDGGSEIEGMLVLVGDACAVLRRKFSGWRNGLRRRRRGKVRQGGGGTALDGEGFTGRAGQLGGGVDPDVGKALPLDGSGRSE